MQYQSDKKGDCMDNVLKTTIMIAAAVLAIGITSFPIMAHSGLGVGSWNFNGMHKTMNWYGVSGTNFDMNAMHKAMHGENSDVDMNAMHQRMLSGNLNQGDWNEMKEHCPMMGGS